MNNAEKKSYARYTIGLLLLVFVGVNFSAVRFALFPLVTSVLFVILLIPLNNKLLSRGLSKNLSALVPVALLSVGALVLTSFCILPILKSAKDFFIALPTMIIGLQNRLGLSKIFNVIGINNVVNDLFESMVYELVSVEWIENILSASFKGIYIILLTPVFVFYILRDKRNIVNGFEYLIPRKQKSLIYNMFKQMYIGISTYIYGYLFIGVVSAFVALLCFAIIRLENYVFLSFILGICSMIPFVGTFIGSIPAVITAANHGWQLWYVIITVLIVFQLSTVILTPKTIGNSINIHPIFGIVSMLFGYGVFGIKGVLLAVPVLIIIKPFAKYIFTLLTTNLL